MNDNTTTTKLTTRRYLDTILATVGMPHREVQVRLIWMLSSHWLDEMPSSSIVKAFDHTEPATKARYYATVDALAQYSRNTQKDVVIIEGKNEAADLDEYDDEEPPSLPPSLLLWNLAKLDALKSRYEAAKADGTPHFTFDFGDGEPIRSYATKSTGDYITFLEESLAWMGARQ